MQPGVWRLSSNRLAAHSGMHLLTAGELIVKGLLESPRPVDLLCGPGTGSFEAAMDVAEVPPVGVLLAEHGSRAVRTPTAERAIAVAGRQVRFGGSACALVPNSELDRCMPALLEVSQWDSAGAAMCILLEDASVDAPAACPRRAAVRLGIPCLEAANLTQLMAMIGLGLQLSEWNRTPVAVVVHQQLLRSIESIRVGPNRVADLADLALARTGRPRRLRSHDDDDLIRVARRLHVNELRGLPNPGERTRYGFLTIGPCGESLGYLTQLLGVQHRVATMRLDMLYPLDETAIGRFLERCENVIVLEPRPGSVEPRILEVAERVRQGGQIPALVWARTTPPGGDEMQEDLAGSGMTLHPSRLIRGIGHLFDDIRSSREVREIDGQLMQVPVQTTDAPARLNRLDPTQAARGAIDLILDEIERILRDEALEEEQPRTCLVRDHLPERSDAVRLVDVEVWSRSRFLANGIAAVAVAARSERDSVLIVIDAPATGPHDVERLARAAAPEQAAERVHTSDGNLADMNGLHEQLLAAVRNQGVCVVVVRDGPPAQYDLREIERELRDVDALGFLRGQRLIRPANEACILRPGDDSESTERLFQRVLPLSSDLTIDDLPQRLGMAWRVRVRILTTQVDVTRSQSPSLVMSGPDPRLPLPQPKHGQLPHWRVHIAGYRGSGAGIAARIIAMAGRRMGFHVSGLHDPALVGPGLHAWSELLFSNPGDGDAHRQIAQAPYGEANLLLGMHADETVRAVEPAHGLCVSSREQTSAVVNEGRFVGTSGTDAPWLTPEQVQATLQPIVQQDQLYCQDFSEAARVALHTDRLTDAAMIGFAFQQGLIPASLAAMEEALNEIEREGNGRLRVGFTFGRRLAHRSVRVESTPRHRHDARAQTRRMARMLRSLTWRGKQRAGWYQSLVHRTLEAMPGLTESDAGRQSQVDLTRAIYRCFLWGGMRYAERYATLILRMYEQDRGDTGRAMTRDVVLPLADAMLLRDPLYVAAMSLSGEEKRRTRSRMNVKLAREDVLERRFLTRLEFVFFRKRFRLNLRTSAWLVRVVAATRHVVPHRWRGTRRKREVRAIVLRFVHDVIAQEQTAHDQNLQIMRQLNELSAADALHVISTNALKVVVNLPTPPDAA